MDPGSSQTSSSASVLEMKNISKRFGGTEALKQASLRADRGEVHALLGENGAGKSTLMKILVGALQRDAGEILIEGREVRFTSTAEARAGGVVEIFQELTILPELSVARNIFLTREKTLPWTPLLDHKTMNCEAERLLRGIGVDVDVRLPAGSFSIARQQMFEIARALSCDAKVLIMDEPTSSLSPQEVESLYTVIRRLTAAGKTVIYISHRLNEILTLANSGTILRDGEFVDRVDITPQTDRRELVRLMIGKAWSGEFPVRGSAPGRPLMKVSGLKVAGNTSPFDLTLRRGEIVGVFGLLGAGRTEMARALFGADRRDGGEVRIEDRPVPPRSPAASIAAGLVLVTEDRKKDGIVLTMPVRYNATLTILNTLSRWGLLSPARLNQRAAELVRRLSVKTPSLDADAFALSGGNQQKVILAKWMAGGAKVYIFDEPTRGIDVEAKHEIYRLINSLAEEGCGILLISSESEEVLGMSDRILVMYRGKVCKELDRSEATDESLVGHATGGAA